MYWRCPECGKELIEIDSEYFTDGQGYDSAEVFYYECEGCGCEFEVRQETNSVVDVTKHGTEFQDLKAIRRKKNFNPSKRVREEEIE